MAYEAEVKRIATWLNGKVDILGDTIPVEWEQQGFETALTALLAVLPDTITLPDVPVPIPVESMLIQLLLRFVSDPETVGPQVVAALYAVNEAS